MDRVKSIYSDRGENYLDTWDLKNQTRAVADATLDRFGIERLTPEQMRLLQLACLIDVKDSRLIGKWNPDSIDDGIAYRASYCTHRDEYERAASKHGCCIDHGTAFTELDNHWNDQW